MSQKTHFQSKALADYKRASLYQDLDCWHCAAHSIKDRRSSTAKAIFALDSKYKWALSGTPLQVTLLSCNQPSLIAQP